MYVVNHSVYKLAVNVDYESFFLLLAVRMRATVPQLKTPVKCLQSHNKKQNKIYTVGVFQIYSQNCRNGGKPDSHSTHIHDHSIFCLGIANSKKKVAGLN